VVETAFFQELREQELVAVAKARVERAEQALVAARRRESVGTATRSDLLRAELDLNTSKQALLSEETNRASAAYALGHLVGDDGAVHARRDGIQEPGALQIADEALIAEITAHSPEVVAAEANLVSSKAAIDSAHAKWMPSLTLSTGYNWVNYGFSSAIGTTTWNVKLGLTYPLFDGFVRDEQLERARSQDYITDVQLSDARRDVRAQTRAALGGVKLAQEQIALAQKAVEVAAEDLRVQQERYGLGVSTFLDLLQSQTSLVEAETTLVTTRFDYQLARAQLEALAGRKL
jgi:outer membrane protein TolC